MIKKKDKFWEDAEDLVDYYRSNIHRFATEYLGIGLFLFQKFLLYSMSYKKTRNVIFFAGRGIGKTFLTMVFCCCKCILYPGLKICVAAPTIRQANIFVDKINELKKISPTLANEIYDDHGTKDGREIVFKNGACIQVVVASDKARGQRCHILVVDEVRGVSHSVMTKVLDQFLNVKRMPAYSRKKEWKNYKAEEENVKIKITSIGTKDEWIYKDFLQNLDLMCAENEEYWCFSIPYQFGIEAGYLDKKAVEEQVRNNATDIKTFSMEMEVIPFGESEFSMFKFEDLNRARTILAPLIPISDDDYITYKGDITKSVYYQKKLQNELRVVSMDIAVAAGRKNDNSVITVFRLFESGDHYKKHIAYIETMNGVNIDEQMLRLKQVFYDLECDYAVIDAGGALGNIAANTLGEATIDSNRNVQYSGWKTVNSIDKFDNRVTDTNAVPVLYCLQVTGVGGTQMQYNMLVQAQVEFQRNRISLLVHQEDSVDFLNKNYGYIKLSTSNYTQDKIKANNMILPFINTTEMVEEAITTQAIQLGSGRYSFDEKSGRKDRIISVIYGLYYINLLELDLQRRYEHIDISSYSSTPSSNANKNLGVKNPFINNINKLGKFGRR